MAISAVGEGCHKQMEPILPQIMDGVIQYLQDPVSMTNLLYDVIYQFEFFFFRDYVFVCYWDKPQVNPAVIFI